MNTHSRTRQRYERREAGDAIKYSAPRQKQVAHVLGLDQSQISRQVSGDLASNASRFYDDVRAAVLSGKVSAGSFIHGAMLVAEEAACALPVEEVRRRYLESCAQEVIDQANEDVATHRAVIAVSAGTPDERAALEAQDEAFRKEGARHVDTLVYSRAYRVKMGWRVRA